MITFKVPHHWPERAVAERLMIVIEGLVPTEEGMPIHKENGSWQLDEGNNWFLTPLDHRNYRLEYRYESMHNAAGLEGLKAFLETFVFNE